MPVYNFNAFVVDLQVFVYVSARLVVEKELCASNFAHGRPLAGIFNFCEKERRCRAVFVVLKVSCVFCTQAKVSPSPESGDYAYVFVLVTSQPGCVLFAFYCAVLCKKRGTVISF